MPVYHEFSSHSIVRPEDLNDNFSLFKDGLIVRGEDLSSQIAIANFTFTVASQYVPGSIEVFVDGVKQTRITDYVETSDSWAVALTATLAAGYQDIMCNYTKNNV